MYQSGLYAGLVRKALALHVHHNDLFSGGRYTEANRAYEHHQSKVVYYQDCYFGFYSSGCVTSKIKSGFNNEELRCNCRLNHCRKHCLMDNLMLSTTFDHNRVNNRRIRGGSFLPIRCYTMTPTRRVFEIFNEPANKSRDAQNTTEVENGQL